MADDTTAVLQALSNAGVRGVEDFGRFVNNTQHFAPSKFDERSAMPVLLDLLPSLTDPKVVGAVAGHLSRPWARPSAFQPLLRAYQHWASNEPGAGWAIGDALATAATISDVDVVIDLVTDRGYGNSRQIIVYSMWRFKHDDRIVGVLLNLTEDPDVCLHAMSALRRAAGNQTALPHLIALRDSHPDPTVQKQAAVQAKKAEKALSR